VTDQPLFGRAYQAWLLTLVLLVAAFAYVDRVIVQTLGQSIKEDLGLTDLQLGALGGLGFAILYSTLGLPIARLAERRSRVGIVSVSVGLFSVMTVLCGTAGGFWQLFLYRIGVGIGEAGVQAPSVSLLADHFSPQRRGAAMTVMKLGAPVGSVIGALAGGIIAHHYGWRAAIVAVAGPGIILALLFRLTLREPPRGYSDPASDATGETPSLRTVLRTMWLRPEFRHMLIGLAFAAMGLFAGGAFNTPFFMRVHDLTVLEAGVYFSIISGVAATAGFSMAGFGIDYIARRGRHYYALVPAIGMALAVPFYLIGYGVEDSRVGLVFQAIGGIVLFFHSIPTLVAFQNMVGPRERATAAFVFFFISTLVGVGLGPPLLGFVSDLYAASLFDGAYASFCTGEAARSVAQCTDASAQGLRYALMSSMALYALGAFHYLLASRAMRAADRKAGLPA
jgi:predicted MFS family arabinose efflux permease